MKKLLMILVMLFWCSSVIADELVLTCRYTEDTGHTIDTINKKKWCTVAENGQNLGCANVAKFGKKIIKTEILKVEKSKTANLFGQNVYYMLDRRTGVLGVYSAKTNKMLSETMMCEKRSSL